jgi:hypothetical protein
MGIGRIFFLFVLTVAFTAGGCTKAPDSSDGIQTETGTESQVAEKSPEAVSGMEDKSRTPARDTEPAGGSGTCKPCHKEQSRFQAYGGHAAVSCEACHGIKEDHVAMKIKPLVRGNEQCIECHSLVEEAGAGKLSEKEVLEHHLRAVEKKHVIKVKREKVKDRCIYCHDPHLGQ